MLSFCRPPWRAAAAAGLLLVPLAAHDLWLVPPEGSLPLNQPASILVASGMDFPESEHAADPANFTGRVVGPEGAPRPLSSWRRVEEEKRTWAEFTPEAPGAYMVFLETRPQRIELGAEEFNSYLLHDGLPQVLAERMERGDLGKPAVERYSKYVKCLVPAGGGSGGPAASWRAGMKLEILPQRSPLELKPGETLEVAVLFEDVPLAHANLCWDLPGNGEDFSGQTWTDGRGMALVPIAAAGLMTLRLIHMTRPQAQDHEWESFWSSFTFRIGAGS